MLRRLSPSAEPILVNLLCFGPFAVRSLIDLGALSTRFVFDDRRALFTIGTEVVCGALAALVLYARGWRPADLGLQFTGRQILGGMLLLFGSNFLISVFYEIVRGATGIDPDAVTSFDSRVTWPVLIALTLINPLYDELFVAAYNVEAARGSGPAFAITLSAAVRFLCHIEQGPIAAVTILPLGLLFAFAYWRWRRLWPLVIAHAAMDFLGMMPR